MKILMSLLLSLMTLTANAASVIQKGSAGNIETTLTGYIIHGGERIGLESYDRSNEVMGRELYISKANLKALGFSMGEFALLLDNAIASRSDLEIICLRKSDDLGCETVTLINFKYGKIVKGTYNP